MQPENRDRMSSPIVKTEKTATGLLLRHKTAAPQADSKAGLVDAAYQAIKLAIRENVFPPGYQAAEAEIARQLGMSRTPVHEAMTRIQEEGLVRILPRRGILVCALAQEDIEEIYEVIIALEGAAAERIASHPAKAREPVLKRLEEATLAMAQALAEDDLITWAKADEDFHDALVSGCGNGRLSRMISTVTDQSHRSRMFTLHLRPRPVASAGEHRQIIAAIANGDAEAASRAARMHRQRARDQILPLIARLNLRNL
jgi:DNA-binding GntR family transcriptional regulator